MAAPKLTINSIKNEINLMFFLCLTSCTIQYGGFNMAAPTLTIDLTINEMIDNVLFSCIKSMYQI